MCAIYEIIEKNSNEKTQTLIAAINVKTKDASTTQVAMALVGANIFLIWLNGPIRKQVLKYVLVQGLFEKHSTHRSWGYEKPSSRDRSWVGIACPTKMSLPGHAADVSQGVEDGKNGQTSM
jgi:UDP-N-acetylmuramyl tripeptide synthase